MIIFDRWGGKVSQSRDINGHLDGKSKGAVMKRDVYACRTLYMNHRGDNKEELGR